MTLLEEIRKTMAGGTPGKIVELQALHLGAPSWILREDAETVTAMFEVPSSIIFYEAFSSVVLYSQNRSVQGKIFNCLNLKCLKYSEREPFASICEDFLRVESRQELSSDPTTWWSRWKDLLGNADRTQSPYSVLGELTICRKLAELDIAHEWRGPEASSHDISCEGLAIDFEVKSTLSRYDQIVSISGQHQLFTPPNRGLFLAFLRFENHPLGESINSTVLELKRHRIDTDRIEKKLRSLGYRIGQTARDEKFSIIECHLFKVGADFPRITSQSFISGKMPPGIVRLSYDLNLSGLNHVSLEQVLGL